MKNNLNIFVRFWGICRSKHWCYERCIPWAYYKDFLLIKQSFFINYFNNSKISIKMSNNSSFMSNDKNRTIVNSGLTWILVINKMWFWKKKTRVDKRIYHYQKISMVLGLLISTIVKRKKWAERPNSWLFRDLKQKAKILNFLLLLNSC